MGGWKDLKTLAVYLRLAGIEEKGVTEGLNFLPQKEVVTPIKEVNSR